MDSIERIVIPTDGSQFVQAAVDRGLQLARVLKKPVLGLYVIDDQALAAFGSEELLVDAKTILQKEAEKALADLVRRASALGVRTQQEIRTGVPAEEIVAAAGRNDLIVISTHGRKGLSRLLLGSVAEAVVRHADCSVLVVRGPKEAIR